MIVKFCGFKTESDIKKIKKLEVDAVGFIHYPDSKRHVSLKQLKYLAKIVPDHIEKVVVVVNPQMSTIKRIINQTDINTIQLHGNESIQLIRNIKKLNSKIRIIKAIPATRNLNNNIQKYTLISLPKQQLLPTHPTFFLTLKSIPNNPPIVFYSIHHPLLNSKSP